MRNSKNYVKTEWLEKEERLLREELGVRALLDVANSLTQPPHPFEDILSAIERLSQGDFNIVLKPDDIFYYDDLTVQINNLAENLSNMEEMRQEFISDVSHELQSPLTSIAGFAELLRNPNITEGKKQHYIDIILAESKRLSRLSDNLLKLSTLDEQEIVLDESFSLSKQVKAVSLLLENQWSEKHIALETNIEGDIWVQGIEDLLQEVWINLLQNAIKFTSEHGEIKVTVLAKNGKAIYTVQDTGVGISAKALPHLFERFYKEDKARNRSQGGSGLGLALAKRIIEIHGGEIKVKSVEGVGTTFKVYLPQIRGSDEKL